MKRFVAILLISLSIITYSFAEASGQPETIKFMGLDWLITKSEFEDYLKTKDISYDINNSRGFNVVKDVYWEPFYGMDSNMYSNNRPISIIETVYNAPGNKLSITNVAGYGASYITAFYVPSYSEEDLTVGEPYKLIRASYSFGRASLGDALKENSIDYIYEILKGKLTSLYGNPSNESNYHAIWYAKDGTGLYLEYDNGRLPYIDIIYGIADDSEYINGIHNVYNKNIEKESTDSNTEGL